MIQASRIFEYYLPATFNPNLTVMNPIRKRFFFYARLILVVGLPFFHFSVEGQMRNIYSEASGTNSEIKKLSFFSPSQGFIASTSNAGPWIGYTADSGRTFAKKFISYSKINFGGYPVNLTFGFGIRGVKALSQNNIFVYGEFGFEPSILYSSDG